MVSLTTTGTSGNDTINFSNITKDTTVGNLVLNAGDGNDIITGSAYAETLNGDAGNDTILGGAGNDIINGGNGADIITGGAGDDAIALGTDTDKDTVVFSGATAALNGSDTITGFVLANDVLNFSSASLHGPITAGTMATAAALAVEGTPIAVATNKVFVAQVAAAAGIDTAAEIVTALTDTGVLDALDFAANGTSYLIVSGADVATSAYVYGIVNDATAAIAGGEVTLLGTITTDSNVFTAANIAFA